MMKDLDNIPAMMAEIGARGREASHGRGVGTAGGALAALRAAAGAVGAARGGRFEAAW